MAAIQITGDFATQVTDLINDLDRARLEERNAKAKREELELKIATLMGVPETWAGAKTFVIGGQWKMVTRRSMNFRVDDDTFRAIREKNTKLANKLFREKYEVNKTAWKLADDEEKNIFAPAVISSPGKVSVSAEKL